jgi:hypothetical protein
MSLNEHVTHQPSLINGVVACFAVLYLLLVRIAFKALRAMLRL